MDESKVLHWSRYALWTIVCGLGFFGLSPAWAASLTIIVEDLRRPVGTVHIAAYTHATSYDDDIDALLRQVVPLQSGHPTIITLTDLPVGPLALAFFHDENDSGTFDTGLFGIPLEGYGFSNDIKPFLSKPSFDDVAVSLDWDEDKTITVKMQY